MDRKGDGRITAGRDELKCASRKEDGKSRDGGEGRPASRTAGSLGTVSLEDGRGARASKATRTTWATRSSGRLAGEPPSRGERGRDGGESQLLQFRKLMPALQARENSLEPVGTRPSSPAVG